MDATVSQELRDFSEAHKEVNLYLPRCVLALSQSITGLEKEVTVSIPLWDFEKAVELANEVLVFHYNGGEFNQIRNTDLDNFMDKPAARQVMWGRPRVPFYALNLFTTISSLSLADNALNTESF